MATFGEFTVARLGMIASQMALNVTGHNISNINTQGYTRQRLDQYSFITSGSGLYHSQNSASVGSGVMLAGVSQLRDPFLDIRFRKEMSSVGSAGATLNGLDQLESVINDVNKTGITTQIQDLLGKLNDLNDHVGEKEFDSLVRSSAEALCQLLNTSAKNLQTVFENVYNQYKQDVQQADNILKKLQELNEEIRRSDINGDPALELRDQRNMLIDQLSEYMKIDVTYSKENLGAGFSVEKLTIKMVDNKTNKPGATLIDGIYRADLSIKQKVDGNGDPMVDADGKPVLDDLLRLSISELYDSAHQTKVSDTKSQFQLQGLNFGKNAQGGPQTIDIIYKDKDGNKNTVSVNFTVVKPADDTPEEVAKAREKTLANLADALNKDATLQGLFTAKATSNGLVMTSTGTGAQAAVVTEMKLGAGGTGITLGDTKSIAAVPANTTTVDEGHGYGALESTRQMLTGAGEFRTDGGDKSIRGIPYYQKSLDALANKFATEMNRINTTRPDGTSFSDPGANGEIAQDQAGNLFTAEGDDPKKPNTVITAGNISISSAWKSGETQVVASVSGNPVQGTMNDNINRLINVFEAGYTFRPSDIVRTNNTAFTTGEPKQDNALAPGTDLTAHITYIDGMNQEHTVEVKFQAGATAEETQTNLAKALQGNADVNKIFTVTDDGTTITFDDKAVVPDGSLCNLVTDISFTDAKGNETDKFSLGDGKIGGIVSGDPIYKGNLEGCYANMEGVLGAHKNTTNTIYETYAAAADGINTSRDSVAGVDLNEEGMNLLQYQKSFAAACRLMTALDEAMDKVINGMGIVGR
ncbi:flagellar hook-associated protein FlgK [Agathobaculum desmolans]|uniref:flagellar hook-associated protein FlgK n=1 Tax=Agathobaculum desmolans TaxID=39484 RepID=UPI00248F18C4|nr:flagellar basal body rod C-terminal domain-containing protein [Agathobaculum desmolans]